MSEQHAAPPPLERLALAVEAIAEGQASLAHAIARLEHGFSQLLAALDDDATEPETLRSLDGDDFGGPRDADVPL